MKLLNDLHRRMIVLICAVDSAVPVSKSSCKSRSAGKGVRVRLRMGDEGSNLVEFALVLPFLVMFLTGIFWIGNALSQRQALTQAVGIAAAQLSESRTTSKDPCTETLTAFVNAAPQLKLTNLTLTIKMNGSADISAKTACGGNLKDLQAASPGSVTVTASYQSKIPMFTLLSSPPWIHFGMINISLPATATEYEY